MKITRSDRLPPSFFRRPFAKPVPLLRKIVQDVRRRGDDAIRFYTRTFDKMDIRRLRVETAVLEAALRKLPLALRRSLQGAARNIRAFASRQRCPFRDFEIETAPGVFCGQRVIPLQRVGVYVPGGRFPLVSSLLMGAIPAQVAGVGEIAVCSPPTANGRPHPTIMAVAALLEIEEMYAVGGIQAIAGLAYGSESIPRVDKIVGPGNRFVTLAKKEVFGEVGIDLLAGPTELFVVADATADPDVVAADLLAQAEHDPQAESVLVTDSLELVPSVQAAITRQLPRLATRDTAAAALKANGRIIGVKNMAEAAEICNRRAPEHLELQGRSAESQAHLFLHFGTLFIGPLSAEAMGDYNSGINHILPTGGGARYAAGLSVRDFLKLSTTLRVTRRGVASIVPAAETMARAEGLVGHARSLSIRRKLLSRS